VKNWVYEGDHPELTTKTQKHKEGICKKLKNSSLPVSVLVVQSFLIL
jgi:hypothetical protein